MLTIDSPPVNALSAAVREGIRDGVAAGRGRPRRQGDRADLRRPHLHRRRRHLRIRQAVHRRQPAGGAGGDRELHEAGHRRDPRHGARRRLRGGAGLPLPRRRPLGQARPAGDQARPDPRRRRHAAAAAADRAGGGGGGDPVRDAVPGQAGEGLGRRRRARRRGQTARGRARASRAHVDRRGLPLVKVRDRDDKVAPARGKPEIFEAIRKAHARKIPRLRGLDARARRGARRGRTADRGGAEARARGVHGAAGLRRNRRRSAMCSSPSGRSGRSPTCPTTRRRCR